MKNKLIFNKTNQLRSSSNAVIHLLSVVFCISLSTQALPVYSVPTLPTPIKSFSAPPADKSKLPDIVQNHLLDIEKLCLLDSLEKQIVQLEEALKGLRETANYYLKHHYMQVNSGSLGGLLGMLFGHMDIYFKHWDKKQRPAGLSDRLLSEYILDYGLSDEATHKSMTHSWAHSLYKGFDCLAQGNQSNKQTL